MLHLVWERFVFFSITVGGESNKGKLSSHCSSALLCYSFKSALFFHFLLSELYTFLFRTICLLLLFCLFLITCFLILYSVSLGKNLIQFVPCYSIIKGWIALWNQVTSPYCRVHISGEWTGSFWKGLCWMNEEQTKPKICWENNGNNDGTEVLPACPASVVLSDSQKW